MRLAFGALREDPAKIPVQIACSVFPGQTSGVKTLFILLLASAAGALAADLKELEVTHAGARFRVVKVPPQRLTLVWKDGKDEPYRTFDRVQADFAGRGRKVRFLMNAGIFEPGGIPSGLHVEAGKRLCPLNLAIGKGNFFLKPNGVFAVTAPSGDGAVQAFVQPADAFGGVGEQKFEVMLGVQSGPLLLSKGERHPAFKEGSENRLVRNGVGVDADGLVVFAITAKGQRVNLWDFAGLFLKLGCKDALFLDGDISQMAVNPAGPVASNRFGAIFAVAE